MSGYIGNSPTIDKSLKGTSIVVHDNTADFTVSADRLINPTISVGGTLTAQRNLILPVTPNAYIVVNNTVGGFSIVVKTPSGTGVTLLNGTSVLLRSDSVNVVQVAGGSSTGSGATGAGTDLAFFENDEFISQSFTLGQKNLISGATISIASPGVVTLSNHGFVDGSGVWFKTTGALPTGLLVDTGYYVISTGLTASTFQLALTRGGTAINTSGTQSGVHSCGKLKNATSAGLMTIATGVTVTIPTNATWVIGS